MNKSPSPSKYTNTQKTSFARQMKQNEATKVILYKPKPIKPIKRKKKAETNSKKLNTNKEVIKSPSPSKHRHASKKIFRSSKVAI